MIFLDGALVGVGSLKLLHPTCAMKWVKIYNNISIEPLVNESNGIDL